MTESMGYADTIVALREVGVDVAEYNTGGNCMALRGVLEGGYELLVTDYNESLSERSLHDSSDASFDDFGGWMVGVYDVDGEMIGDASSVDGSTEVLLGLVFEAIGRAVASR